MQTYHMETVTFAQDARQQLPQLSFHQQLLCSRQQTKEFYVAYFLRRQLLFCSNRNYHHFTGEETDLSERTPNFPTSPQRARGRAGVLLVGAICFLHQIMGASLTMAETWVFKDGLNTPGAKGDKYKSRAGFSHPLPVHRNSPAKQPCICKAGFSMEKLAWAQIQFNSH